MSIKEKQLRLQELESNKRNKMSSIGDKIQVKRMNNTGYSSTAVPTNNKSHTKSGKDVNSSNNKSYASSTKHSNKDQPPGYRQQHPSPQGLRIKKEQSDDIKRLAKKKMQSAPRGSHKSWMRQEEDDLYIPADPKDDK